MAASPENNRRRTKIVDGIFQGEVALSAGALIAVGMLIGVLALLVFPVLALALSRWRDYGPMTVLAAVRMVWPVLLMTIAGVFALAAYVGMLFSHRIAGPVFRLKSVLAARLRGETPGPIVLRRGDYYEDVARQLNSLFERDDQLREEVGRLLETIGKAFGKEPGEAEANLPVASEDSQALRRHAREIYRTLHPAAPPGGKMQE